MSRTADISAILAMRTPTGSIYAPYQGPRIDKAFMVIVGTGRGRECDQICGTRKDAERERKDLIAMDVGAVSIREFASWLEAEAFEDKLRGY